MAEKWIKLYHEILTDPKMGMMSDKLFRRTIELFLLAGKENQDGKLPEIEDIAWILRISKKEMQKVIDDLVRLNIITIQTDPLSAALGKPEKRFYVITHFSERQKSEQTKSESNRAYYEKRKLNKTESQTEIQSESKSESKSEIQKNSENVSNVSSECKTENKDLDKDIDIDIDINTPNGVLKREREKNSESEIQTEFQKNSPAPSSFPATTKKQKTEHRDRGELKPMGKLKNVLLSEDEVRDLNHELGGVVAAKYIDDLSLYIGDPKNSNKYTDHYLTVLRWYRRDQKEKEEQQQQQQQKVKTLADMGAEEYAPSWDIDL